jgi:hypothetical protein
VVHAAISIVLLQLIGIPWLQRLLVCSSNGVRLLHRTLISKVVVLPAVEARSTGWGTGELLDSAGRQELVAQLDGVPDGSDDAPGCLDVVTENSASAAEIDC